MHHKEKSRKTAGCIGYSKLPFIMAFYMFGLLKKTALQKCELFNLSLFLGFNLNIIIVIELDSIRYNHPGRSQNRAWLHLNRPVTFAVDRVEYFF